MAKIWKIDIWEQDREKIIAHLDADATKGEALFWILPNSDDGSSEWDKVTEWLAIDGNNITDDLKYAADVLYQIKRRDLYPTIQDQLDMQYWDNINGTTNWKDAITKIKADNPKG